MPPENAPTPMSDEALTPVPAPAPATPAPEPGQDAWSVALRQLRKNRLAMAALVVLFVLTGIACFAPLLASGRPLFLRGHLTNVYESDLAAFGDWHKRLREVDGQLRGDLTPADREAHLARRALYVEGLPDILDRLEGALGAAQPAELEALDGQYRALLEAAPGALDLDAHARLGQRLQDLVGGLSLGAAYAQASSPLLAVDEWLEATADAQGQPPGQGGDPAALERQATRGADMADKVERGATAVMAFLRLEHREELGEVVARTLPALRTARDPAWRVGAARKALRELTDTLDRLADYHVDPVQQLLPRVTRWPAFEYLSAGEVGAIAIYLAALAALLARRAFAALPGAGRTAWVLGPGVVAAAAWAALVPSGLPPADATYKEFARALQRTGDDGEALVVFPLVPFGENENIYQDRKTPPVLWERPWADPDSTSLRRRLREPGEAPLEASQADARLDRLRSHLLGTDSNGRDVLSRLIIGSRVSLSVGFVAVAIYITIGVVLGALAGYFRGVTDIVLSRVTEVVTCFPSFFLIITVMSIIPRPSIVNIMIVIGLTRWTETFRLVRGEFLRLGGLDFVTAARALGLSAPRVVFRHVLPNALGPVFVAAAFGIAGAILTESALSYLGFGVPQPQASWGSVLNEAKGQEKDLWWITVFPGLLIFLAITAYNLLGEGLRDALDPRLRK